MKDTLEQFSRRVVVERTLDSARGRCCVVESRRLGDLDAVEALDDRAREQLLDAQLRAERLAAPPKKRRRTQFDDDVALRATSRASQMKSRAACAERRGAPAEAPAAEAPTAEAAPAGAAEPPAAEPIDPPPRNEVAALLYALAARNAITTSVFNGNDGTWADA